MTDADHPEVHILGIDLSLNHAGFVGLDESGNMAWFGYVTDKIGDSKAHPNGVLYKKDKAQDRSLVQFKRLAWWEQFFEELFLPPYVGVEDYAQVRGQSNSDYQIGELGGLARLWATGGDTKLRLHEPMSVKMYVAHNGAAKPEDTRDAVFERWPETKTAWAALPKDPTLDLCSAYGVARMVWDEVQLRCGKLRLDQLHPKEVQVYNRITKANPVNLLDREFITR